MTPSRDLTTAWMRAGQQLLEHTVQAIPDYALSRRSLLPGWSRAHVVGHLSRNAEALLRLATWARTGVETAMYTGPDQRAREIEASAALPPAVLRTDLERTAAELGEALDGLSDEQWTRPVRSALGRTIAASEIPWLRAREVWLHAIDLDTGAGLRVLPPALADALLDDACATISTRPGCPSVRLAPEDRDRTWQLGASDQDSQLVKGPAHELLGWVTGRTPAAVISSTRPVPEIPRWI